MILPPFGYKLRITSGKVFGSNLRICFASCFFRTERGRVCWGSVRVNALDWPRALTHRTRETAVCMPVCMPHARICPLACFPFLLIRPTVSFLPYFFLSILLYTQHYSAPFLLHFFASSSSLSCACGIHKYGRWSPYLSGELGIRHGRNQRISRNFGRNLFLDYF